MTPRSSRFRFQHPCDEADLLHCLDETLKRDPRGVVPHVSPPLVEQHFRRDYSVDRRQGLAHGQSAPGSRHALDLQTDVRRGSVGCVTHRRRCVAAATRDARHSDTREQHYEDDSTQFVQGKPRFRPNDMQDAPLMTTRYVTVPLSGLC